MIAGSTQVLNALKNGSNIDKIYLDNSRRGNPFAAVKNAAMKEGVPVQYVPAAKLDAFHIEGHDGCIAQLSRVKYQDLQQLISWVTDSGEAPLFLMLDGITDIRNIGGIARTAYCMGVHALIIPAKGVGALNEDAILTSAGALEKIPVCRVNSLMKTVDELHQNGIVLYASEMTAQKNITETDFTLPCTIVLGSEEKGIYPALLKICDEQIKIPMMGDFESLNVSVATGMILYETMRQRSSVC